MVVEDDSDCLEAVSDVLEHQGYAVIGAADGLEALRALESGPAPDLILLDLMLPVMDGWKFLEELRARPGPAQIPVVLLSGERDLDRRASELSVSGALSKPVDLRGLLSTLERLIGPAT